MGHKHNNSGAKDLASKWLHHWLITREHTHSDVFFGEAEIGYDLHAVKGGDQLSEVLLADPETSVFRVGC